MKNFGGLIILIFPVLFYFSSCKPKEKISKQDISDTADFDLSEWLKNLKTQEDKGPYRASYRRINDLLHTKLEIAFDWEKQQLKGKATLSLKPYFYPTDSLTLDAKGYDLHEVALVSATGKKNLNYNYDGLKLRIKLDKTYLRNEEYHVFIDYTAKPEELETHGSKAITSDKGLYFINPLGKEENKPRQIWTQGETEANSCWFPTIDAPNERMTQEIFITIDTAFVTLSNGLLLSSKNNGNGTRTDHWKQSLGHAPYLAMLAIGKFAIVKDKIVPGGLLAKTGKNIEVSYYVEPEYEKYAKTIFGNTPEMLDFFSEKFGIYPWEKYAQVVVRDYVSGAMENTSATLHGEFLHQTPREMLDGDNEDIISHELFHHWFGDLVTCESWSNLPLNESFATYGEYLWREYKYGRDAADHHLENDLNNYLREAAYEKKDMIRFYYNDKEDMFDSHSYAKGGRILHVLRKYVGDDAFFSALKLYLEKNKFTSVEIHQLRLAFEETTGEDLNWFFNQWFLAKGHPELNIVTTYSDNLNGTGEVKIFIEQTQDKSEAPLYKLPMAVDVYQGENKTRHYITLEEESQNFVLPYKGAKPDLTNVDAEKMLLCTKEEEKEPSEYIHQYRYAPLYLDRLEAIQKLASTGDSLGEQLIFSALNDRYWKIRSSAVGLLSNLKTLDKETVKKKAEEMALNDEKAAVRGAALKYLNKNFPPKEMLSVYEKALNDSSYNVSGIALGALVKADKEKGLEHAEMLVKKGDLKTFSDIATVYMQHGGRDKEEFFTANYKRLKDGNSRYGFVLLYSRFLQRISDNKMIENAIPFFTVIAEKDNSWFMRLAGLQAISELKESLQAKADKTSFAADEPAKSELANTKALHDKLDELLETIIAKEKDSKVLKYVGKE